jgi:hypothetical protein
VIFLKDGSSLSPTDYWIADNRFYYVLGGQQQSVALDRVDLPRTNDVNHRNGATFWLKSSPGSDDGPPVGSQGGSGVSSPAPAVVPQVAPDTASPVTL